MLAAGRRWLAPPVFEGDEEKTRVARLLHTVILCLFTTPVLLLANIAFVPANRLPVLPVIIIGFPCILSAMEYFMRRGHVRAISVMTVVFGMLFIVFLAFANGGADRPVNVYFGLEIVMAGLLLGGRGAIATAICSTIALGIITLAGAEGVISARLQPPSPVIAVLTFGVGFMLIGLVLQLASESLGTALNQARRSRAELQTLTATLEQRVVERTLSIALLNELGERLQASDTASSAYGVIGELAPRLFPKDAGVLFIFTAARDAVEPVAAWGAMEPVALAFAVRACRALSSGHMYCVEQTLGDPCEHVPRPAGAYVCMPLAAQGEAIGVLHLRADAAYRDGDPGPWFSDVKLQLVQTAAESMALTLANLKLRDTLREQAIRDSLTGLFNRRYMEETLERELQRAARDHQPVGVIMLDVDYFKAINDKYGHKAGDLVLSMLGANLRAQIREEDIACRYGGEEFTLIMPTASLAATRERAEQVRAKVKQMSVHYLEMAVGPLSVSLGVAVSPEHGTDGETLIHAADAALYRAKHMGRDHVVVAGNH